MSKKEGFIKWKTVETTTPSFPDGAILIKEDTSIEFPLAIVGFPLGDMRMERKSNGREPS